jgi:hypothetical protein
VSALKELLGHLRAAACRNAHPDEMAGLHP